MIPVLVLSAMLAAPAEPDAKPAPIPERWLLKYAPKNLPELPEAFAKHTWNHRWFPRFSVGAWEEWVEFAPETERHPGTATITRADAGEDRKPRLRVRTVPLAVYGPLVEYDGNLHTVAITNWEKDDAKKPRWVLNLGAAVEVRKNVWYQAGSERFTDGKVRVREYRLEFADDPRTQDAGKVKVFTSERFADKFDGETRETDAEFVATKGRAEVRSVVITLKPKPNAVRHVTLQLGDGYYPSVIDGVSRASPAVLTAALVPPPKVAKEPPPAGLMQPPKKPGK